ncbi:hypothetical protein [Blastococcus litoris]|uniref:hypothetical protein n=1 Tax=Blastococcus litoris TaxID=2171622 RepID=UPI000E3016AA|nr:hypothetical protein [Blastococcus litoris]
MAFVLAGTVLPAAQAAPTAPEVPVVDPAKVVIDAATGVQQYRFPLVVPAGGTLQPADPAEGAQGITREVVVVDAKGAVVGAYDSAVAIDSAGHLLPTYFSIEGSTLVQTVAFDPTTAFPVAIDPAYTKAGRVALTPPPPGGFGTAAYVGIPSNYVYNPKLGTLHDYCSYSPDEFPSPVGANANFRGPCARHDLCYAGTTSEFTCDNRLRADMRSNCEYTYAWYNPMRGLCYDTANVYWAAVVLDR